MERPPELGKPSAELFALGTIVAAPGAIERMERHGIDAGELLGRHHRGDCGDIDPEDVDLNEEALRCGGRLLSAYGTHEAGDDRGVAPIPSDGLVEILTKVGA